jgi:hypothetical protein
MSDVVDTLTEGLLEREAAEGSQITYAGETYPCSGGAEFGGKKLELGGWKINADVSLVLRTAVFAGQQARPREKQLLAYTSQPGAAARALRIDSATLLYNAFLLLECNDPNRPA